MAFKKQKMGYNEVWHFGFETPFLTYEKKRDVEDNSPILTSTSLHNPLEQVVVSIAIKHKEK